jgi:DMSO/TMAO reductase YedYZ molybdopterin-dependent catalytic subunit
MKKTLLSALKTSLIIVLILASLSSTLSSAHADSNNSTWNLNVSGLVNQPLIFTLKDLQAMPQTTISTALICVDFPSMVVAQGNWTGVKLWTLLNQTGVLPEAIKVALYANDGYSTDLTIAAAKSDEIILALSKDGVPLSEVLRLVVPGHWGYKWIAYVVKIELVDYDFQGKWESLGYSDEGFITPSSQSQTHPFPSVPSLTTSTVFPSSSPKQTPTPSSSIPPITNSTQQLPVPQSKNLNSQNFNLNATTTAISIAIAAIIAVVIITIIKTKKIQYKKIN